ncbi:MAG: BatA domain-containing protein [Planctomycetales bacterium]|nr:BatA domain-containing protein [Planctomycetales bacterium]
MGFLSPALLAGIAFIAIPIALHLVMRREPRRVVFPALRFVQQRRESNRRKMQLRHWLLLALRCLVLAAVAFAMARPTLKGSGLRGKEGAPLAVAVVIDNAPRMSYVSQDVSRLQDAAQAAANWVARLPDTSEAAVFDRTRASAGFAVDLATAEARLRNLTIASSPRPLVETVVEALQLVASRPERRQELFLISDMSTQAWSEDDWPALAAALVEAPDARLYIVDVGDDEARNAWLGDVELSSATPLLGEPLRLEVAVRRRPPEESLLVELWLQNSDGEMVKSGERIAVAQNVENQDAGNGPSEADDADDSDVVSTAEATAVFELSNLPLGTSQGVLKLLAGDPLPMDNERYFSASVRPPARILLWCSDANDALFVEQALAPTDAADVAANFVCDVATFGTEPQLDEYDAVWLLDPPELPAAQWQALWDFAQAGGGVGVFLGHRAGVGEAFNGEAAQRILPGQLVRRSHDQTYLRPQQFNHPALAGMRDFAEAIPWSLYRVYEYWEFGDMSDAYVVARFANNAPALVERRAGRGRLLTMATPLSDPADPEGRQTWNILPTHVEPWPFVALCDELARYLSKLSENRLNYFAGESARVRLPVREPIDNYILRQPDGQVLRRVAAANEDEAIVSSTEAVGNYRLTAGGTSERLDVGFSVNYAGGESELARVNQEALRAALPEEQVQIAAGFESAEKYVDIGRSGRELFPWALLVAALAWSGEHLLANRFYREAA